MGLFIHKGEKKKCQTVGCERTAATGCRLCSKCDIKLARGVNNFSTSKRRSRKGKGISEDMYQ